MTAVLVFWFFALYGIAAAAVALIKRWNPYAGFAGTSQVKILLCNSEETVEGTVRALTSLSRLTGTPVRMMICDFGSNDQTEQILRIMGKNNPFLFEKMEAASDPRLNSLKAEEEPVGMMTIDLRHGFCEKEAKTI